MGRQKSRNLWNDNAGAKSVNRPQQVTVAKGWKVTPDLLPAKPLAPRRRKYAPIRPNNRDAVAIPLGGQSYNPVDEEHQEALAKAVRQLTRRKLKDEKFMKTMTMGRAHKYTGNFSADKTWEEEVQESSAATAQTHKKKNAKSLSPSTSTSSSAAVSAPSVALPNEGEVLDSKGPAAPAAMTKDKKAVKKKKKKTKKETTGDAKRAMIHRRHPHRDVVEKETDDLDTLLAEHTVALDKREMARQKRRAAKKANLGIKHYGRHYHTPLVIDVAPTDKLVGSLRHLSGGYVHPIMERMKSLEERNLVLARMRHTYNKRKVLKPKGEVRVKREEFGVMPETSF